MPKARKYVICINDKGIGFASGKTKARNAALELQRTYHDSFVSVHDAGLDINRDRVNSALEVLAGTKQMPPAPAPMVWTEPEYRFNLPADNHYSFQALIDAGVSKSVVRSICKPLPPVFGWAKLYARLNRLKTVEAKALNVALLQHVKDGVENG